MVRFHANGAPCWTVQREIAAECFRRRDARLLGGDGKREFRAAHGSRRTYALEVLLFSLSASVASSDELVDAALAGEPVGQYLLPAEGVEILVGYRKRNRVV